MLRIAGALTVLAWLPGVAGAQGVLVAPHAVYLDHRTRSASITLYNPGVEPTEVTISSEYGYPITDSLGHFTLAVPDSIEPSMPAATAWIDAFPRRMAIAPLQRQTVRLLARPPQGLADGEYWSRLVISARGGAVPVTGAETSAIQIALALEVRTNIPLLYRKGPLQTGVRMANLRTSIRGDSLLVRARLTRQGGAAYVGTARGSLVDRAGAVVASFQQPIAVYYDAEPAFAVSVQGLPAGSYRLRLELATERSDLPPEVLLRTAPVRDSIPVVLP